MTSWFSISNVYGEKLPILMTIQHFQSLHSIVFYIYIKPIVETSAVNKNQLRAEISRPVLSGHRCPADCVPDRQDRDRSR